MLINSYSFILSPSLVGYDKNNLTE